MLLPLEDEHAQIEVRVKHFLIILISPPLSRLTIPFQVKEQALCMLANIADGDASKKLIVDNEDMLKKLKSYMLHNNPNLQVHYLVLV